MGIRRHGPLFQNTQRCEDSKNATHGGIGAGALPHPQHPGGSDCPLDSGQQVYNKMPRKRERPISWGNFVCKVFSKSVSFPASGAGLSTRERPQPYRRKMERLPHATARHDYFPDKYHLPLCSPFQSKRNWNRAVISRCFMLSSVSVLTCPFSRAAKRILLL